MTTHDMNVLRIPRVPRARLTRAAAPLLAALLATFAAACAHDGPGALVVGARSVDSRPVAERHPVTLVGAPDQLALRARQQTKMSEHTQIACQTCHSLHDPAAPTANATETFHKAIDLAHGSLSCQSCHQTPHYATFRGANGLEIHPPEVNLVCAQCHGTQHRAWEHGAHGGMIAPPEGVAVGARERMACIVCHDPHAPRYPTFVPAPPPRDRGVHPAAPVHAPSPSGGTP